MQKLLSLQPAITISHMSFMLWKVISRRLRNLPFMWPIALSTVCLHEIFLLNLFLSIGQMSVIPKRGYEPWFQWVLQSPNRCPSCGIYTPVSALSKRPEFRNTLASCAHPGQPVWALITIKLSSTTTWIIMNKVVHRTAKNVWQFCVLHNMLWC